MQYQWTRDLKGYAGKPPHPEWPDDARVAVSFVLNIEEGAERSILHGDKTDEGIYDIVQEGDLSGIPALQMLRNFAYGSRVGYWRVVELLEHYGVTCTFNACGQALEATPWIAHDAMQRGFEVTSHGYRWETNGRMTEEFERDRIKLAVSTIERICGKRPVGWHTRGGGSLNTRRLLIEEGGFIYDSDSSEDDLPYLIDVGDREFVVVPYAQDTNDMRLQRVEGFQLGRHLAEYCIEAFDWLYEEGAKSPKMMTIGLHGRIIGRPGRIGALNSLLKHMRSKPKVWYATRLQIAQHWLDRFGKYR